jgi:3-oxoacyl-[acyl-carrier protein] reductase
VINLQAHLTMAPADRLQQVNEHLVSLEKDQTRIDGHVVLITGAAQGQNPQTSFRYIAHTERGIGRAAANLLAQQGAKIAINDVDEAKARMAVEELTAAGHEAFCLSGDMLNESFPDQLVKAVVARFGKINCLINNAGRRYHSNCKGQKVSQQRIQSVDAFDIQASAMIALFTK